MDARHACGVLHPPHSLRAAGDVVPEKDLIGCWPLWTQFAPDELRYVCNRTWSADPGLHDDRRYRLKQAAVPCWRTCWTSMGADAKRHCTAECPSGSALQPATAWRAEWDRKLANFLASGEGKQHAALLEFVEPIPMDRFIYNVY